MTHLNIPMDKLNILKASDIIAKKLAWDTGILTSEQHCLVFDFLISIKDSILDK